MNTFVRTIPLTFAAAAAAAAAAFAITLGSGLADRSEAAGDSSASAPREDGHAVNANGDTYGPISGGDDTPDLIGVTADDGVTKGYAYQDELGGPGAAVTTPEEAEEYMQSDEAQHGYTVPVYLSDGETQVGTFTVQGFQDIEEAKRSHPDGGPQTEELFEEFAKQVR